MEKILLFGTGKISKKYTQILRHMPLEIEGYIDNDRTKWGSQFYDREVISPETLLQKTDSNILIACAAKEEITKQLSDMNLGKRIVSFYHLLKMYRQSLMDGMSIAAKEKLGGGRIVIDNFHGSWGGAEDWCHIVARSLIEKREVVLIEKKEQYVVEGLENHISRVDADGKDTYQLYHELTSLLMHYRPFIFVNVWNCELLWAAATVKLAYPDEVCMISNILCDDGYSEWCEWDEITENYFCISDKIKTSLVKKYQIQSEKVCYLRPFIEKLRKVERTYNLGNGEAIKIGYPCRLVREQKRADLIPQFIEYLEGKKTNYVLHIAGDGPCKEKIEEYVEKKHLQAKVKLYGRLTKIELINFLNQQDIYLNFSEYEGTSLTMLESMASGCVPVVTNVSGVSDFVESGVNGLIADVGDMEKIAEYVDYLDQNRGLLREYGSRCMDIVNEQCRLDKYMDRIERILEVLEKE